MAKRILRSIFSLVITSSVMATAVMASSAAQTELYVNSDYNSETEGWGTTRFANYEKALAYAKDNAKKATMIFEKTTTVSGNCFTNEIHKNLTGLGVVVQDGAVVGNAASKWDMTYPVTIKPGARLVTARTVNAGVGNSHIKNTLTVGEAGSDKQAVIDFHKGSYQDMSIAVLYNGKLVANNALIKVGDLGLTGTASINDTFDKTIPVKVHYEDAVTNAYEPQDFLIEVPLSDLNIETPTDMYFKVGIKAGGREKDLTFNIAMTW